MLKMPEKPPETGALFEKENAMPEITRHTKTTMTTKIHLSSEEIEQLVREKCGVNAGADVFFDISSGGVLRGCCCTSFETHESEG
jgi:hypothetical protein